MPKELHIGFEIKVVRANALTYKADALVLKYSQAWTTLSRTVIEKLPPDHILVKKPPRPGAYLLEPTDGAAATRYFLLVGTPPRREFTYDSMFELARTSLHAFAEEDIDPPVKHLAMTVHGLGWGFDEAESLKAMVLGFRAAVDEGRYPNDLERITILESSAKRADVLAAALNELLGETLDQAPAALKPPAPGAAAFAPAPPPAAARQRALTINPDQPAPKVETPSLSESSIFVAMPFAKKYSDAFYYVIQPCVKELGYQCIRLDQTAYTGDIVETIKKRIKSAELVVALLDGANPNVYLEVGYAWGVGTPTVLLLNKEQETEIPFDIRQQKRLVYESLFELKPALLEELRNIIGRRKQA